MQKLIFDLVEFIYECLHLDKEKYTQLDLAKEPFASQTLCNLYIRDNIHLSIAKVETHPLYSF